MSQNNTGTKTSDIENLLKPRYKVIADYPQSRFNIGEILIPNRLDGKVDNQWVNTDPNDKRYIHTQLANFPHLFELLAWYEEREASEMPEYVKYHGKIMKVSKWHIEKDDVWFESEGGHPNGYTALTTEPATLDEYNQYINKDK